VPHDAGAEGTRERVAQHRARLPARLHDDADLEGLVDEGKFHDELFYRVASLPVQLPPLRDRAEDIPPLVKHYAAEALNPHFDAKLIEFTDDALAVMGAYHWPGNITELTQVVLKIAATTETRVVTSAAVAAAPARAEALAHAGGVPRRPGKAVHRPGPACVPRRTRRRRPGSWGRSGPPGWEPGPGEGAGDVAIAGGCRFPACREFRRAQPSPKSTPMPKRTDLKSILIIGAGPIVIGQACEFDYSGTQACKALKEEGYRVILVNSNPATIMTDPEFADVTYIEPLTVEFLEKIIAAERPDALLPTLGGQTALNLSMELHKAGILEKYGVEMIGAKPAAIAKGEDRELFKQAMLKIGLDVARSRTVKSMAEAREAAEALAMFPLIIRPSFTLGGSGGGIAYNKEEFERIVANGLDLSPVHEVLVEECLLGWKEYEMEVMRDHKDQCVVICSIENFDPMGVHTGDSITVAPAMTLTDKEYQVMRDASFAVIREIGVETGGSNIQFSVDPDTGRMVVIEMNPRVSRSSALASKATGFPIAKIAAKLAVGYSLDELRNDITRLTPASFEPTIDYVVTKIPRFTFEKFPDADPTLTSAMKSVGEAMAIGRTFKESMQKCLRSLEIGARGFGGGGQARRRRARRGEGHQRQARHAQRRAHLLHAPRLQGRLHRRAHLRHSPRSTAGSCTSCTRSGMEQALAGRRSAPSTPMLLRRAKSVRFLRRPARAPIRTDLARRSCAPAEQRRQHHLPSGRHLRGRVRGVHAVLLFQLRRRERGPPADRQEEDHDPRRRPQPHRPGHRVRLLLRPRELRAARDRLRERDGELQPRDRLDRLRHQRPPLLRAAHARGRAGDLPQEKCDGVIVQFGGQTPLNLATALKANGVNIIGTSPESIELAEDRKQFSAILDKTGLKSPANRTAMNEADALKAPGKSASPCCSVRPSCSAAAACSSSTARTNSRRSCARRSTSCRTSPC
jgi:carbamoyl-phosphate synthase large subunit